MAGCGTTALERRAVINYAKASSAFGDFIEDDFLNIIESAIALESTAIALAPDQQIKHVHRFQFWQM